MRIVRCYIDYNHIGYQTTCTTVTARSTNTHTGRTADIAGKGNGTRDCYAAVTAATAKRLGQNASGILASCRNTIGVFVFVFDFACLYNIVNNTAGAATPA